MADGFIPDRKMNHQLMRLIEKDKRRPQFDHRNPNRWTPRGSGGGEGGGGSSCITEDVFNFVVPYQFHWSSSSTLKVVSAVTGQKPGPIRWYFDGVADASAPGGDTQAEMYKRNRNNGFVQWTPTEAPVLTYLQAETAVFAKQLDSEVKVYTAEGTDVTSADLVSAWIVVRNLNGLSYMGVAELAVIIEVNDPDAAYNVMHTVYSMPGRRSLTQGRPAEFSDTTWFVFGGTQSDGYRKAQDVILSDETLCVIPTGTNISGTAAAVDVASPDLVITFAQAFTGTANPNEYANVLTITAHNNSSENMTVQYDKDLLFLNLGQTTQLSASSTFAANAGSTGTKVINTTVTAAPGVDVVSIVTGSLTATGDTTSKAYEAYGYQEDLVE